MYVCTYDLRFCVLLFRAGQVPLKKEFVPNSNSLGGKGIAFQVPIPVFEKELGTKAFQVPNSFALKIRISI